MIEEAITEQRVAEIRDVGMLDLRYAKVPEDLAHIREIHDVGMILVPEHLVGALSRALMHDIGAVVPVPQEGNVHCLTGQIQLSGEALSAGDPDTILLIAGQAFITGLITSVGYREIRLFGQMFVPRSGSVQVSSKLTQMSGQVIYIPDGARLLLGEQTIGREYLELLPHAESMVICGAVTFEPDVTRDLVQEKIPEIVLLGHIRAPRELIPMLQVITREKMGDIEAIE